VTQRQQKAVRLIAIAPPPADQRLRRDARAAAPGDRRTRYSLPAGLESASPVGYRTRMPLTRREADAVAPLLSLERPRSFAVGPPVREAELFEESALGVLSARQSTNFRGQRTVVLGPEDSATCARLLRQMEGVREPVLDGASHTHVVLCRPYRTPFTLLLTFVGHRPVASLATVPVRALRKRLQHIDDIPSIGTLPWLHLGVLADGMERAAVIASGGQRQANAILSPFCERTQHTALEKLVGLTAAERRVGWRIRMVTQVGATPERIDIPEALLRKVGGNLLAFRSERIQPGVNAEEKAPPQYQRRQDMTVPEELAVMAARGGYNAFAHWTGCEREEARRLLLLERVDVLTPGGKERLRAIRRELGEITDRVVETLPLWADLPLGRALSRNANRGRKAFALAGQRIYIGGLDRGEVAAAGLHWHHALAAFGAAASRAALVCELSGCIDLPADCDLLGGCCLMAGPVNQNDIGKAFFGYRDLLADAHPARDPTSLLVWTLKAKTVADPIGNEEQLLNAARKGALVDLRCGPHEVVAIRREGDLSAMRADGLSTERAFEDQGNFVSGADGAEIPGGRGQSWPQGLRSAAVWG